MARLGRLAAYDERLRAVLAVSGGQRVEVVAEVLAFARATVFGWVRSVRRQGEAALQTKPTPGRASTLTPKPMERLRRLLVGRDPRQLHFDFALWSRALVGELIEREFGARLDAS
ncbi:MAG: helix-turn-helix domain-containing protein [Candidatus Dormibacteria bacterium]